MLIVKMTNHFLKWRYNNYSLKMQNYINILTLQNDLLKTHFIKSYFLYLLHHISVNINLSLNFNNRYMLHQEQLELDLIEKKHMERLLELQKERLLLNN